VAIDDDHPDQLIALEHRHSNPGPNAPKLDAFNGRRLTFGISSCRCEVRDLDHLLGPDRLGNETTRSRIEQTSSARLGERWWHIVCRNQAKSAAFRLQDDRCAAQQNWPPMSLVGQNQ